MDYKEKYEALLANIKAYHARFGSTCNLKKELEECVPELAESEDERIWEKVIEVLKLNIQGAESQMQASRGVNRTFEVYACKKVIACLKEQKKQKPAEWSEEDKKMSYFVNQFLEYHEASDPTAKSCKEWFNNRLKSLRPQPHEELDEEEVDIFIEDVKFPFQVKVKSTGKIVTITSGTENEDGASYAFFWAGKNRYLPED